MPQKGDVVRFLPVPSSFTARLAVVEEDGNRWREQS